jgi:L-asparaginase II
VNHQNPAPFGYIPLVETTRGGIVESIHFGALVAVDRSNRILASAGDPATVAFLRSSAKPFQALPFLESGGVEAFGLSDDEIALICASHSGSEQHISTLRRLQEKVGISEADLQCGVHSPYDPPTAEALLLHGEKPSPLHHNCSGKHTGMLAFARMNGWTTANYLDPSHPVQQRILAAFAEMCSLELDRIVLGTDGCSAPNFAVPLRNAALAYARLCDPSDLQPARQSACRTIVKAMWSNPEMVSGTGGFDTELMRACRGRILSKGGAEGYQALGIPPDTLEPGTLGLGIALKIADGDGSRRARSTVSMNVLERLNLLRKSDLNELAVWEPVTPILNQSGTRVGVIRPCFELQTP